MNRREAKQINQNIHDSGFISKKVFTFLEQEIDKRLEEELKTEKIKVKQQISSLFNDNYLEASAFFKHSLKLSY
ncbi:hypothetical protein [Aquimarina muelleri]|uniref:Uncharacterized protein n=1 Tax=Aquimarina muelleri TaxID=279356 RepID=A0A918JTQ3_9FLAO|nr:hypothetical protein [Aquimarina muelleri]MCX2761347.1 hypothetical protein [Aquimarina muelleri]GGX12776.1 hypothetical protein GCM10007384_13220 [Aquimarina muelleri]